MKKLLVPVYVLFIITASLCKAQNPIMYGMTYEGGRGGKGTIFKVASNGTETDVHDFGLGGLHADYPFGAVTQATNGLLYGMTSAGGSNYNGLIFSYNISTNTYTDVHDFGSGSDGKTPKGSLIQASNGLLYGMTSYGGDSGVGMIFSFDISTGTEIDIHDFGSGTDGQNPIGSLFQANNNLLYGMTVNGGTNGYGMIFSFDITTGTETDIHDFGNGNDGRQPQGSIIQASNGILYGVTAQGGNNSTGIIFSYTISNSSYSNIYNFGVGSNGQNPYGSLIQTTNGLLYGLTAAGGNNSSGTIFNYTISTNTYSDLHDFGGGTDGVTPYRALVQATNGLLYGMTYFGGAVNEGIIFSYNISNSAEADIHDFGSGDDGQNPYGSIIQANNGLLYGMTEYGVSDGAGILYNYTISTNSYAKIYDFGLADGDGQYPVASLIQASNGVLYGMTPEGGRYNEGTLLSYNIATGLETDLYDLGNFEEEEEPSGSLIQASNGLLYGTIFWGGADTDGIIFSYDVSTGVLTDVYDFKGGVADGQYPDGALFQASNGLLYGMTSQGGPADEGTIFSFDITTGAENDLWNFGSGSDGQYPQGCAFIQATNGLLYGMTPDGGKYNEGIIFSFNISTGAENDLHDFSIFNNDGKIPSHGSLLQASNGLLYGMTQGGGAYGEENGSGNGTIFSYNISTGTETVIYNFGNGADGIDPLNSLIQPGNGLLYGMTTGGGVNGDGIIFNYNITTGTETDMHDFSGSIDDGSAPWGNLLVVDTNVASGVNQLSVNNNQLSIYPNPSSGQFTIKLNGSQNDYTVEVYNVMGEKIYQSVLSNLQNTINLGSQPAGMYFVYLKSDEGVEFGKVLVSK